MNHDAAIVGINAALAFVVRDDDGLLVISHSKLIQVCLVREGETKIVE